MTLSQIAGTLGLDEIEAVRPIPLTDDMVGPVPPRPKNRAARRDEEAEERRARRVRARASTRTGR
jgi:hypothetical protein